LASRGMTISLDQFIAAASSRSACAFAEGRPPPSLSTGGQDRRRHTEGRVRPACLAAISDRASYQRCADSILGEWPRAEMRAIPTVRRTAAGRFHFQLNKIGKPETSRDDDDV
jgi:hypothetical protein